MAIENLSKITSFSIFQYLSSCFGEIPPIRKKLYPTFEELEK
jgi:hypothetical protein